MKGQIQILLGVPVWSDQRGEDSRSVEEGDQRQADDGDLLMQQAPSCPPGEALPANNLRLDLVVDLGVAQLRRHAALLRSALIRGSIITRTTSTSRFAKTNAIAPSSTI